MVSASMIEVLAVAESSVLQPLRGTSYHTWLYIQGLMYVKIRPFTDEEAGQLPAVFLT